MSELKSVAVVGAGKFGKYLAEEFLSLKEKGSLSSVTILTRSESQGNEANNEFRRLGAKVIPVDYDSASSLVSALTGVDVVVSVLGAAGLQSQVQGRVAEAAKQAGVKLFVPSEFGTSNDGLNENGVFAPKFAILKSLKELGLPYAIFYNGLWPDLILSGTLLGLDFKNEKATIHGIGDSPLSWTTRTDAAQYIGYVLTALPLSDLEWKTFRIEGDRLSWNQLVTDWEARSGKKLAITRVSREELEGRAKNPGDWVAAIFLLWDRDEGTVGPKEELTNHLYPAWRPIKALDVLFS